MVNNIYMFAVYHNYYFYRIYNWNIGTSENEFGSKCYKVFGQKFSLYREGSSLLSFNFVPSFSGGHRENLSPKTL